MASCTCHVFCGTKRLRLERIVRPPQPVPACDNPTPEPNSTTSLGRELGLAVIGAGCTERAAKNSHSAFSEVDSAGRILRRVAPARSRGVSGRLPIPLPRMGGAQRSRRSGVNQAAGKHRYNGAGTRPNTQVKPRRVVEQSTCQAVPAMCFA
jgi:hypothetical protein